jgi:hypothetical protein
MLTDSEILELRGDIVYKNVLKVRFEKVVQDILQNAGDDFKPELNWAYKFIQGFVKGRIIRTEFALTSQQFMENILNRELKWPREPKSVKETCESRNDFIWMRFDEERVKALCNKSIVLLKDAEYRNIIKNKSTITIDKNERLGIIINEIQVLLKITLFSMKFHGIFNSWVDMSKEEFFEIHGEEMQFEFVKRLQQGNLGFLPLNNGNNGNEN